MRDIVLVGAFVILWFFALFIMLPIRMGGSDADPGHGLPKKFLFATAGGVAMWAVFYGLVLVNVIVLCLLYFIWSRSLTRTASHFAGLRS